MSASEKIQPSHRLISILARRRRRGGRIVFTNGVFDLVHAGHVAILRKARSLGDCLVVGLNSDASVRRLKGPRRPLNRQRDRAEVLAALEAVDYVTLFSEDTPYRLIRRLRPDILVKGGDYAEHQIVGRDLVRKVVRIPLVRGRSTTSLIAKVLKAYGRA